LGIYSQGRGWLFVKKRLYFSPENPAYFYEKRYAQKLAVNKDIIIWRYVYKKGRLIIKNY